MHGTRTIKIHFIVELSKIYDTLIFTIDKYVVVIITETKFYDMNEKKLVFMTHG